MTKIIIGLFGVLLFGTSCSDYISSKRDGMRPFNPEMMEQQAQEADEKRELEN